MKADVFSVELVLEVWIDGLPDFLRLCCHDLVGEGAQRAPLRTGLFLSYHRDPRIKTRASERTLRVIDLVRVSDAPGPAIDWITPLEHAVINLFPVRPGEGTLRHPNRFDHGVSVPPFIFITRPCRRYLPDISPACQTRKL